MSIARVAQDRMFLMAGRMLADIKGLLGNTGAGWRGWDGDGKGVIKRIILLEKEEHRSKRSPT